MKISSMSMVMVLVSTMLGGVVGCGSDDASSGGGPSDCKTVCTRSRALKCAEDDLTGCEDRCDAHGGIAKCTTQWDAAVACTYGATLACDAEGDSGAAACKAQEDAFISCAVAQ
jgi:hypothetical protein